MARSQYSTPMVRTRWPRRRAPRGVVRRNDRRRRGTGCRGHGPWQYGVRATDTACLASRQCDSPARDAPIMPRHRPSGRAVGIDGDRIGHGACHLVRRCDGGGGSGVCAPRRRDRVRRARHVAGGVACGDFDGDGWFDLYFVRGDGGQTSSSAIVATGPSRTSPRPPEWRSPGRTARDPSLPTTTATATSTCSSSASGRPAATVPEPGPHVPRRDRARARSSPGTVIRPPSAIPIGTATSTSCCLIGPPRWATGPRSSTGRIKATAPS